MQVRSNKSIFIEVIAIVIFAFGWGSNIQAQRGINKYSDPVIREIHDLADHRDSLGLLKFLKNPDLNYQGEALMCFGSVQSPGLNDSIAESLNSEMDGIRMAAAFALGQSYHQSAVTHIKTALGKDTVELVRGMLFDALGKTGDQSDLNWLSEQMVDFQETEGLSQGILRFGMRGVTSLAGNNRALKLMETGTSTVGAIYASYHLGRYADSSWLAENVVALEKLYRNERDPVVGSNLISGVIKGRGADGGDAVEIILKSDADYRDKVNALNGVSYRIWDKVSKSIFKLIESDDPNIAVAAAEAITRNSMPREFRNVLKASSGDVNWRARALLLGEAMELAVGSKNKNEVEKRILELFHNSSRDVEKAWLLKALATKADSYGFVEKELQNISQVIQTYAMETLTLMVRSNDFQRSKELLAEKGIDLNKEFFQIFKNAVASNDIAIVSMAAGIFRDKDLGYGDIIEDFGFLKKALEEAQSPNMIEAKNELISTLAFLTGEKANSKTSPAYNHPIDWDRVMYTPSDQVVSIQTSKGEVLVQLNVNWCPGTVSTFLELVESGYYDNKLIHRVVPNFVVQDGCPRGDGWGGPPFTIRSEFTPSLFMEGTFGMASAGKDTEGSQWYFTHTSTPHLDGKYTKFGSVVNGIDVVHKLEVGDSIQKIEIVQGDLR